MVGMIIGDKEKKLKLNANTKDELVLEVNDDLSAGLGVGASFNIIAYGFVITSNRED